MRSRAGSVGFTRPSQRCSLLSQWAWVGGCSGCLAVKLGPAGNLFVFTSRTAIAPASLRDHAELSHAALGASHAARAVSEGVTWPRE